MLEKLLEMYEEKFGKPFPLVIVANESDEEIIRKIKDCILDGKEAQEPEYDEDLDY